MRRRGQENGRDLPPPPAVMLPTHWTGEQALAVFEVLDQLRQCVWDVYGLRIQRVLKRESAPRRDWVQKIINEEDVPF